MNIWQIACGEPQRDYRDVFLRHDVMLIGPGWPGPFDEKKYRKALKEKELSFSRFSQVRSFKEKPMPGDLVLLRIGHDVKNRRHRIVVADARLTGNLLQRLTRKTIQRLVPPIVLNRDLA